MQEIICAILFILSLGGMFFIFFRKAPEIAVFVSQKAALERSEEKKSEPARQFSKNLILQKALTKFRILVLKTDNKTSEWMKLLRQKSKENKVKFSEGYWDKLRK